MPEINITKPVKVQAKTLSINLKICDGFIATIKDQDGDTILDYEGYVPDFMPGQHCGDYVELDIDLDTGKITNWKPVSAKAIETLIRENRKDWI